MRLNRIDLTRFGIFTDQTLDLPPRVPDFHVIVGPNEAGKSTLRSAISELLFGIGARSPFDFVHDYHSMSLGALVSDEGQELEFVRLKRNKQSLRDSNDDPLPDGVLGPFLGAADRAFFERMFALDHRQLEKGGMDILDAKDDVARMLFEASAGLGSLGDFRDQLESEAKGLWDKRKSKDREYYQALERYDSARAELKEVTFRVSAWKKANQRVDAEIGAFDEASEALAVLEVERGRLERIRRVAVHIQARRSRLQEKTDLGEVVRLPEVAAEQLDAARGDILNAEAQIRKYETLVEQFKKDRDDLSVDEAFLSQREAITDLEAQRHEVRKYPVDIGKREAEVETRIRDVERIVRDLGWEMTDDEALARRIPSQIKRTEVNALLQEYGRLEQAATGAAMAMKEKDGELAAQQEEIESQEEVCLPVGIEGGLASARALGDVEGRRAELRGSIHEARQSLEHSMADLLPWRGDGDALRNLVLPDEESVREIRDRHAEVRTQAEVLKREILETRRAVESRELEEQQLIRSSDPVTPESLTESREERDGLWKRIRSGSESAETAGDRFEEYVEGADQLADRRYQEAEQAEKLESIRNQLQQMALKRSDQDEDACTMKQEIESLESKWQARMEALGIGDMPMSAYSTWRNAREKALIAADASERAEARLTDFENSVDAQIAELSAILVEAGWLTAQIEEQVLAGLVEVAEQRITGAEAAGARREQLVSQHAKAKSALVILESSAESAKAKLSEWTQRWNKLAAAAGLPRDGGLSTAHAALQLQENLAEALKDISSLRRDRIQTMQRDLDAFRAKTADLVSLIRPALANELPDRAAGLLSERLKREEATEVSLREASEALKKNEKLRDDAREQLRNAHEQIRPLLDSAHVDGAEALAKPILLSDTLRGIDDAIEAATDAALQNGDGLDLKLLEAEVDAEDVTTLAARLEELKQERDESVSSRDDCLRKKTWAEAVRDKMSGQADAASAASRSEEALAEMATVVERYLKVFVGARLLRWSIDRYREEKQDPLLRRAGEIFANLTLGSFEKLTVNFEGNTPKLLGRRPDGKHTDVDGMSEATRDQLFMALRLAAVEIHLDHANALPFIADDLFVNYDDDRSKAGFEVLGELARHTQVIFLTHHEHLVPVAKQVLGSGLNVIPLER